MPKPTLEGKVTMDDSAVGAAFRRISAQAAATAGKVDADFGKAFQNVAATAVKGFAAAAVAGTAAFGALAVAAARGAAGQIEAGRQLQILSRQTGATVGGLFVLQQRFKTAGLSADLVGISIERLQKALAGVADVEAPEAGKRLAALNLNFAALQKMRPDQQFNAVGKAIAGLADPTERTAASMAIFGKSGAALGALFSGSFGQMPERVLHQGEILARNAALFEQVAIRLERVGDLSRTFYAGVAERVAGTLLPILDQVERVDLVGVGERFGDYMAHAAQIFAGTFVVPKSAFEMIQDGLAYTFTQSGNVLLAGMSAAGKFFQDGMIQGFQAVGESLVSVLMRSFDKPLKYFQAGLESAMQTMEFMSDVKAGKKADPLGGMSEETRQQQLKQVRRLKEQYEAKGNVVGNPSYREALKYEARLRDYDPSKYAHAPEDTETIYNRRKGEAARFGLYGGGKTADDWQKDARDSWGSALHGAATAFHSTNVDDVLGAGRYKDRMSQNAEMTRRAGAWALGQTHGGLTSDQAAAAEVASTNHRPETRPAAYRAETLPHAPGAETLPTRSDRPLSAPYTPPAAGPWSFGGSWLGKMLGSAIAPEAPTPFETMSHAATMGGMSGLSGKGSGAWGGDLALQMAHSVGAGTALDFDSSQRSGWTGARDAFAGFSPADPKNPDQVAAAARERNNYSGTSGGVFRNGTGLSTGGLGGGAYGLHTDVMKQLSGRTGGTAKTPELGALGKIHDKLDDLYKVWAAGSGGGGSGGGGATVTGR